MDTQSKRNVISGAMHQLGAALSALLTFPIVARELNDDGLGAWALLGAASFMLGLADLGLTAAVQRAAVAQDIPRARRTLSLSLLTQSICVPIGAIVAFYSLNVHEASKELQSDLHHAAFVGLFAGAVASVASPYRGFAFARGAVRAVATARTLGAFVQIAVLGLGFLVARSLLVPAVALLANYLVETYLTVRAARSADPELPLTPRWPTDWVEARNAFRDGAAQLANNAAVVIALRVDLFVLNSVAPLATVAAYGVAGRAVDQAYLIAKQATVALMPKLGNPEERAEAVRFGTVLFAGTIVSGMAGLAWNGQPLLILWVGDVARGPTPATVLHLLALASAIMSTYEVIASMVMLGARTGWSCAVPVLIGSSVNLAVAISFAPSWGVWAVAGSTVVGNAITAVLLWLRAGQMLAWNLGKVMTQLAPVFFGAIAAGVTTWSLAAFAHRGPLQSLIACITTFCVGCAAVALTMRADIRSTAPRLERR